MQDRDPFVSITTHPRVMETPVKNKLKYAYSQQLYFENWERHS